MAFVTIDNPGGVLHHGGQMAWDAISDTRIVMATISADFKTLIQEIDFVDGQPVVGVPSFVAPAPTPINLQTNAFFRPKIKNIGNGLVFVMAPGSLAQADTSGNMAFWGLYASASSPNRSLGRYPNAYMGYIMERNASGQYAVKSTIPIPLPSTAGNSSTSYILHALCITKASATEIRLERAAHNTGAKAWCGQDIRLTISNGLFTGSSYTAILRSVGNNAYGTVNDIKVIKDLNGNEVTMYAAANAYEAIYDNSAYSGVWLGLLDDIITTPTLLTGNTSSGAAAMMYMATPGSTVIPDKSGKYYAVGNHVPGQQAVLNGVYLPTGKPIYGALDSAYVTDTGVVCIAGGDNASTLRPYPCDNDLGVAIYNNDKGTIRPLQLSFRQLLAQGQYIGSTDPVVTPYHYGTYTNNNKIIHKIDNEHFALIGCFMDSPTADPKLGVISVSL